MPCASKAPACLLCKLVIAQEHDPRMATLQCNAKGQFAFHRSHFTLHAPHFISSHLTSSPHSSSHFLQMSSKFLQTPFISSEHAALSHHSRESPLPKVATSQGHCFPNSPLSSVTTSVSTLPSATPSPSHPSLSHHFPTSPLPFHHFS